MQRAQFLQELENIHNDLLKMGSLVEDAIINAIMSLKNKDIDLAKKTIDNDEYIDELESSIEDRCIKFIATQHPLASDLREITTILRMITDLERIGDHAEDICRYTIRLSDERYIKELIDIPKMADLASNMVKNSLDAFVKKDVTHAKKVWNMDEEIDSLFKSIYDELIGIMSDDNEKIYQSTIFLFISAHLERIADYSTNICEKIVYIVTGKYKMDDD